MVDHCIPRTVAVKCAIDCLMKEAPLRAKSSRIHKVWKCSHEISFSRPLILTTSHSSMTSNHQFDYTSTTHDAHCRTHGLTIFRFALILIVHLRVINKTSTPYKPTNEMRRMAAYNFFFRAKMPYGSQNALGRSFSQGTKAPYLRPSPNPNGLESESRTLSLFRHSSFPALPRAIDQYKDGNCTFQVCYCFVTSSSYTSVCQQEVVHRRLFGGPLLLWRP
jgi:hypothetical protein